MRDWGIVILGGLLATIFVVMFAAVWVNSPAANPPETIETEIEIYGIPESNLTTGIVVQYLDGDEIKVLRLDSADETTHIHLTNESEPRLIRNDTIDYDRHGILVGPREVVRTDWHIYLPRED
jgi:DNA/RNA endonuclease YhcR with UshA esterase domain